MGRTGQGFGKMYQDRWWGNILRTVVDSLVVVDTSNVSYLTDSLQSFLAKPLSGLPFLLLPSCVLVGADRR